MTKICSRCKTELPATNEYFHKNKDGKNGLHSICNNCNKEYNKQYDQKNALKILQRKKVYRQNKKEYLKQWHKKYREKNREYIKIQNKKYQIENADQIKEHYKQWYKDNTEKVCEWGTRYYQNNIEHVKQKHKEWHLNNRDKCQIVRQRSEARKKQLPSHYNTEQWKRVKQYFDNKCAYCGKEGKLAQDHFIALSKGGEYTINNIIPACMSCNSSKKDSDFFKWYPKQKVCSKKREQKILKYLNYKDGVQQLQLIEVGG